MNIIESLQNLNISEECYSDLLSLIDEKLVDVVNRAIKNGKLPPFKKETKLTTYHIKNKGKKNDRIAPGDHTAELFVKAEEIPSSDDKISDKQLNKKLNNTPMKAYRPLEAKINREKFYDKGDEDLNGDKQTIEVAVEKSKERNKRK